MRLRKESAIRTITSNLANVGGHLPSSGLARSARWDGQSSDCKQERHSQPPLLQTPSTEHAQRAGHKAYLQGGLHRSSASCQTRTSCLCGSSAPGLSSPPLLRTSCWEPMETRHTAPLRSTDLNKCFSHTLTSSLNIQFGLQRALSLVLCVGSSSSQANSVSLESGEVHIKKKIHAAVGHPGYLINCYIRDPFPQYLTSKLTGKVPEKLSRVVTTWNKVNLTPSASRTRSWSEYMRGIDSWEESPRGSSQTTSVWLENTLTEKEWTSGNYRAVATPSKLGRWDACLHAFSPGLAQPLKVEPEQALRPDSPWAAGPSRGPRSWGVPLDPTLPTVRSEWPRND